MISLEPELRAVLPDERLIAPERREIFSIYNELRFLTWGGVMLIATGAGILIKDHFDRSLIVALVALAAAGCYGYAWWKRGRAESLLDDYILLLGALLLTGDVGYFESQFHVFGDGWAWHLLILTIVHGATAYAYRSRVLLSLSISALAGFLGAWRSHRDPLDSLDEGIVTATRALFCGGLLMVWREIDRRLNRKTTFTPTFQHFAVNFSFWGALILTFEKDARIIGGLIAVSLAILVVRHGLATNRESYFLYGFLYGMVAVDICLVATVGDALFGFFWLTTTTVALIVIVFVMHRRFTEARA